MRRTCRPQSNLGAFAVSRITNSSSTDATCSACPFFQIPLSLLSLLPNSNCGLDLPAPMKLRTLLEMPNGDSPMSCAQDKASEGMATLSIEAEMDKRWLEVLEWLNYLFPDLDMPPETSEEEMRARLLDGALLCGILMKINPGYLAEIGDDNFASTTEKKLENIRKFVSAVEQMGLPGFNVSDLQQGSLSAVVYCLWSLKDHFMSDIREDRDVNSAAKVVEDMRMGPKPLETRRLDALEILRRDIIPSGRSSVDLGEERRHSFQDLNSQCFMHSVMSELAAPPSHSGGHKFHEVFQLKHGSYCDLPSAKISEMMKSSSLDNAPTQSLLSIINGVLEESIEKNNGEIPQRVSCLLKKVMQEIERRLATQAEHIRNQNNIIKTREEKYRSRIRVLETLATGTSEETKIIMNQLQLLKTEKYKIEETNKLAAENMARLMKEKEWNERIISELKQELEIIKRINDEQLLQMEINSKEYQVELERKLKNAVSSLTDSENRIRELDTVSQSKFRNWNQREQVIHSFTDLQLRSVQKLRSLSGSIKHEIEITQNKWCEELSSFGRQLKVLVDAAENYHNILAENRRLYNEVQELKGNIRVYCRIRPFLPSENKKQTTIEYISENGELLLANPSKQGKGQRMFKFNKVFGPAATQEEVFLDTQPLVRSVLDGYRVCIFAYGQTGSGKTYTMAGPDLANEKDWGVNYRALNDLFHISRNRRDTYFYEVGVQMVEIYNEQVRDLLVNDGPQKKLGILVTSQPNGFSVPDASLHSVSSTSDVLELMKIGHNNRAVGATALNERSSRSHSIVTVHVRGTDLKTGTTMRGSLHLIDLAGSERVDRSEVRGDRLKEAQHINKSLSALGDVIFSLSQKSSYVPYRNSKLTQLLQSALGGHAKTLMFVQINSDIASYSETLSTLKFAERVSGVELGAAKSQKEGKDIRDLMEQVASLKGIIERKNEEIEQLHQLKDTRSRQNRNVLRHSSSSPCGISELAVRVQKESNLPNGRMVLTSNNVVSDHDNCSNLSESGSQQSMDDIRHQKENLDQPKLSSGVSHHTSTDPELFSFEDADSDERLSDISDGILSMGTETDASICSLPDDFPEQVKSSENPKEKVSRSPSRLPKAPWQKTGQVSTSRTRSKDLTKPPSPRKCTRQVGTPSRLPKPRK